MHSLQQDNRYAFRKVPALSLHSFPLHDFCPSRVASPGRRSAVRVQTRVTRISNDVVRLHSLAYRCGTHGKSSQCSCRSRLGARPGPGRHSDTDTLHVCQVQRNRPAQAPAGACSSVGRRSIATSLQRRGPVPLPKWVSGKFKSMSGPVTSWPEPGARLDPRRSSDTSQKVPCDASVELSVYILCNNHRYHHGIYAGSVVG